MINGAGRVLLAGSPARTHGRQDMMTTRNERIAAAIEFQGASNDQIIAWFFAGSAEFDRLVERNITRGEMSRSTAEHFAIRALGGMPPYSCMDPPPPDYADRAGITG